MKLQIAAIFAIIGILPQVSSGASSTVRARRAHRVSRVRAMTRRTLPPPRPAPADSTPGPQLPPADAPEGRTGQPGPVNMPHNRGMSGAYAYAKASAPPDAKDLAPLPSIEQDFLSRIAASHVKGARVKATRTDNIKDFDPNRTGDQETLVLTGTTAPESVSQHNREQGGKPTGGLGQQMEK